MIFYQIYAVLLCHQMSVCDTIIPVRARAGCAPRRFLRDSYWYKGGFPSMPLIVCTIFFILLFSFEGFWFSARAAKEARRLHRYEEVEHPRYNRTDRYLDSDWA